MPIYEYRCADCRRRVSVFFRSFSAVGDPVCPRCGGTRLTRLMSRIAVHRGAAGDDLGGDDFGADDEFGGLPDGLDEDDPRAMARMLRRMSDETGEPLEPEMAAALGRLEAGEDPERVMAELDESPAGGEDDDLPDEEF
ncbi:MAG TPA: zinc ribbon domain-containing protein [Thermomicrobiales bacterium]|nr:zinc ribbon domain-containing protein [Thermomicrobiales bacterium]